MLLKLHAKLTPGWVLIQVNFDPIQEIGPKVGGGRSFVSGPFFARLRYWFHEVVSSLFNSSASPSTFSIFQLNMLLALVVSA